MADPLGRRAAQCATAHAASTNALSCFFRQHHRLLVGYLALRLNSEHEAREVAQEAYVRLLESKTPDDPALLRAWLFKIATNISIDRLRHRQVQQRAATHVEQFAKPAARAETEDPAQQWLARERVDQLLGYLQELPETCRRVIDLHRLQGFGQQEVGAQLGVSARMVRRYLTYAMVYCQLRLEGLSADRVRAKVTL